MTPIAIKDFKLKKYYTDLVQKELFGYLWEGIYKPLFEILNINPSLARNDFNIIREALQSGKLYYTGTGFKIQGKFSNNLSKELERLGAVFDSRLKMYRISQDKLPNDLLVSLAESKRITEQKIQLINSFLQELQGNIDFFVDKMAFHYEVFTILSDAQGEIKKNVKKINVIVPDLDKTQKEEIAKSYTENMKYYIKKWVEKDIISMREKVQEAILNGYREDYVQKMLEREYNIGSKKAKFLAQNETSIMLASYKKTKYSQMGFNKFRWNTIMDGKERKEHAELNGRIFSFDNLPVIDERTGQTGLPGETYNCRCSLTPIME